MVTGVKERMLFDGTVLKAPGKTIGRRLRRICREKGAESVAVCLLHSYANDAHEVQVKKELLKAGVPIVLSSEVLPEFREYERLTTTLINAYLGPVISTYIKRLNHSLGNVPLHIQQSNGGVLSIHFFPVRQVGCTAVTSWPWRWGWINSSPLIWEAPPLMFLFVIKPRL